MKPTTPNAEWLSTMEVYLSLIESDPWGGYTVYRIHTVIQRFRDPPWRLCHPQHGCLRLTLALTSSRQMEKGDGGWSCG